MPDQPSHSIDRRPPNARNVGCAPAALARQMLQVVRKEIRNRTARSDGWRIFSPALIDRLRRQDSPMRRCRWRVANRCALASYEHAIISPDPRVALTCARFSRQHRAKGYRMVTVVGAPTDERMYRGWLRSQYFLAELNTVVGTPRRESPQWRARRRRQERSAEQKLLARQFHASSSVANFSDQSPEQRYLMKRSARPDRRP